MLCAIFCTKGVNRNNTYIELEKPLFLQVLKEAGIIKIPQVKKAEPKEGDGKKKGKQAAGK